MPSHPGSRHASEMTKAPFHNKPKKMTKAEKTKEQKAKATKTRKK